MTQGAASHTKTARHVLERAVAALHAVPLPGINARYIDRFVGRNERRLVSIIESALTARAGQKGTAAAIESAATAQSADASPGVPTLWGGLRSEKPIPLETVQRGQRVVLRSGEHGRVANIQAYTWTTSRMVIDGSGITPDAAKRETSYDLTVQLESGRTERSVSSVFEELAAPTHVVPDIQLEGHWQSPAVVWRTTVEAWRSIGGYDEKLQRARKADRKQEVHNLAKQARRRFEERFRIVYQWRKEHVSPRYLEQHPGLDAAMRVQVPWYWRLFELETGIDRPPGWERELRLLAETPTDWATRFHVGEAVLRPIITADGVRWEADTIAQIDGPRARLASAPSNGAPAQLLFYLRHDPSVLATLPTYTEPVWLFTLAQSMLAGDGSARYPERGAIVRAVKQWLAGEGVIVRTRVNRGSFVSSISLEPDGREWSAEEYRRLGELIGGVRVRRDGLSFEPWRAEAEAFDPYSDYAGKGAGLKIPAAQVPNLAPLLASALKAAGQQLNRVGEAWLARLPGASGDGHTDTTMSRDGSSPRRGGATTDQRQTAADGCQELDFQLEGYGRIRVVCGQAGRRDVWHNVWVNRVRHGFNGGRWARRQVPPRAVLEAIRARGVTIFEDAIEHLDEPKPHQDSSPPSPPAADDDSLSHLDPVVAEVVELGGLRSNLVRDIAPELRGRARAIPGFLRPDGLSWLELAAAHYGPDVPVVEGSPSLEEWAKSETEGTDGYAELLNFALGYSFADGEDDLEDEDMPGR